MKKQLLSLSIISLFAVGVFNAQITTHERITFGTGEYDPASSWHGIIRLENTETLTGAAGSSFTVTPDGTVPITSCAYQSVYLNFLHGMYVREGTNEIYGSTLFTNQNNVTNSTNTSVAVGSIAVFTNASSINGATTPSRHIFGNSTQLLQPHGLFVDTVNDRIYVANTFAGNILVFNNASTITGNVAPNRVISYSLTMGSCTNIDIDIPNDRMFLACMPSAPGLGGYNQPEVCIYNNASAINGNVAPDIRIVGNKTRLDIRNQTVHNLKYNPTNKLLAVGHHTNELLIFDLSTYSLTVSSQTLNISPRILLINEIPGTTALNDTINHNLYGFFWDISTDKVYISDGWSGTLGSAGGPMNGTINKIKIYSNLSSTVTAGIIVPDKVIAWSNSTTYWPPQPIWITKTTSTVSAGLTISANKTICSGTSVALTVGGGSTYTWAPTTALSVATGSSVMASPTATITYSVNGSAVVTVMVLPPTNVSVSGNLTICKGNSTQLTANLAPSYTWAPGTGLSATNGGKVTATPSSTTTYSVTGTAGTCSKTIAVTVVVVPIPTAAFTYTLSGMDVACTDASTGSPTTWSWSFSYNAGTDDSTSTDQNPTFTATVADAGYTVCVTVMNSAGCLSSDLCKEVIPPGAIDELSGKYTLNIYPNPANAIVYIDYSRFNDKVKSVKVLDISGREMLSKTDHFESVDVSQLNSGIYFIQVIGQEAKLTRKITVQNK